MPDAREQVGKSCAKYNLSDYFQSNFLVSQKASLIGKKSFCKLQGKYSDKPWRRVAFSLKSQCDF